MPGLRNFAVMLTPEEQKFIDYWKHNRDKQKKFFKQLALGLPLGLLFAAALFINLISGWYKRATMVFNSYPSLSSLILVLIVAMLLIVVFISVYSVKHRWDLNEQRYRELVGRDDPGK